MIYYIIDDEDIVCCPGCAQDMPPVETQPAEDDADCELCGGGL